MLLLAVRAVITRNLCLIIALITPIISEQLFFFNFDRSSGSRVFAEYLLIFTLIHDCVAAIMNRVLIIAILFFGQNILFERVYTLSAAREGPSLSRFEGVTIQLPQS